MEQQELFPIPSPCIGVCEANNKGYCKGCLRNRKERQLWYQMNNRQKRYVIRLCHQRRLRLQKMAQQEGMQRIDLPEQLDFGF